MSYLKKNLSRLEFKKVMHPKNSHSIVLTAVSTILQPSLTILSAKNLGLVNSNPKDHRINLFEIEK